MEYTPVEGIDYIVDLYAVAKLERDADQETVDHEIRQRLREYHPDRVEGLAPEFRDRAELMGRLLTRANTILRDPIKRQEYDQILTEWKGLVSIDGIPIISMDRRLQVAIARMNADEARQAAGQVDAHVALMLGIDDRTLAAARRMVERYPDDPDVRAAYEEQLLERDRYLALREVKRTEMIDGGHFGIQPINETGYRVGIGYGQQVSAAIEAAKTTRLEHERWLALGGASGRLAILSGEPAAHTPAPLSTPAEVTLPPSFEALTADIAAIAREREDILQLRLANLQPTYPEAELQTEASNNLIIGFTSDQHTAWLAFHVDPAQLGVENIELDDDLLELLEAGNVAGVIERGHSVMTVPMLEQIEPTTLLNEAIQRHWDRLTSPE